MIEKPLFPTMFYETRIDKNLCFDMLNEIKSKKSLIDTVSEATQIQSISEYSTDYVSAVHIEHFWSYVVPQLQDEWKQMGRQMANIFPWVSCYSGPTGRHTLHNHTRGYNDSKPHYSAIIYLSGIGVTEFFSTDATAAFVYHAEKSEVGKVIYFPSIIPHQYTVQHYDGNDRYVLPFNFDIEEYK